ncbi:sensor histidine kinase [Streptomyces sp. NPDC004267]|uniref:sensor histidine kinase n=1 Tax=Streptomyces sp. NPDC004267 TaxID=3364694 RepID=UPI003689085F
MRTHDRHPGPGSRPERGEAPGHPARPAPPAPVGLPMGAAVGLLALAGLVYGAVQSTQPGLAGRGLAASVLVVGMGLGWTGWVVGSRTGRPVLAVISSAVLALVGGAMAPLSSYAAVVVGVAALCAATQLELLPAAALTGLGLVAATVALAVDGEGFAALLAVAAGGLSGLLLGVVRHQRQESLRAQAELAVARERSAVEHERAELLAERNRIAREVHDVLAHTLSALSVQMTALDSLVEDGADTDDVRKAIGRSRRLAVEGLEETRRAVRALREEPVALAERLGSLAAGEGAAFQVGGAERPLPAAAAIALVRAAQEALTNTRKHAPGTRVTVDLDFRASSTRLTVTNTAPARHHAAPADDLAGTGGGFGLTGMRERVELLGGTLTAGPHEGGWRTRVEVPA